MHGIFNVHKPSGITSHDVVNVVRRAAGVRRVGHAGTLDPAAEGVLLICVGQATRVSEFLVGSRKTYCAEIRLGIETDTYDAEGQIVFEAEDRARAIARGDVDKALLSLTGPIAQLPPIYSAIKKQGKPLYKLARAGQHVELEPRAVEIYRATIFDWQPPVLTVEIECSKGTYIRSFAHDLGQKLGCGAYLSHLVRLASGRFRIEDAVPLQILEDALRQGYGENLIYPLDYALLDFGAAILAAESQTKIAHGQSWDPSAQGRETESRAGRTEQVYNYCRAYSLEGEMFALLKLDPRTNRWQPDKVFATSETHLSF